MQLPSGNFYAGITVTCTHTKFTVLLVVLIAVVKLTKG
jgi:hypothetical protein